MSDLWKKSIWGGREQTVAQDGGSENLRLEQVQGHWGNCLPLTSAVSLVRLFRKSASTGQGIFSAG